MAEVRRRRTREVPEARNRRVRAGADNRHLRYQMEYVDVGSIVPYEFNPRDNAGAIESVANSIKLVGFIVPVVLDRDNVVVAGHTRIEAAKRLRLAEVPTIRAEQLTVDQLTAFRAIDNKTAELAKWDFDLLSGEIAKLRDSGITLTDFGWTREELDCLDDMVQDDCLSTDGLVDLDAQERLRRAERRAPSTARFVLGELVFFIQATDYRNWVDGVRTLHDYNEVEIVADLKRRLGITETP
jgi:hypothetical protein